jgi:predicted alpha/beta-fold hydrolase
MYSEVAKGSAVSLQLATGGGHLGFISAGKQDLDRRWLDWRLVEWSEPK